LFAGVGCRDWHERTTTIGCHPGKGRDPALAAYSHTLRLLLHLRMGPAFVG